VPVTTDLLARIRCLDDLHELVAELGYTPGGDELSAPARARLGLGAEALGVRRAAIVGRRGPFVLYGAIFADVARHRVALATERLARATAGERNLLLAIGPDQPATLAVAAVAPAVTGFRARQLRIPLERPSAVAAEILGGLTPRSGDTALSLSMRVADALAEEGLTSRFFREFTRLHDRAAQSLTGVPRATTIERRDLSLVILTRVLFLYFVQAKGWLAGRSDFLPSALDTALRSGRPFHRTVFEPLCFGALSTPRAARRGAARALGEIPFLNGGLFERHALERRFPEAALPDDTWRALFDEMLERFHFTVRERDDDAVDPEMLGRVFEGLMAAGRRRSSGTYFTPRDLLRSVVSQVLDATLPQHDADAIRSVRILDPAVGSGAFLLEALAQLDARRAAVCPEERPLERRRAIVRDNLFGVDTDPMAVRLAELRLWLALVADDDASWQEVLPLPNLDQNLRQGDSLLSPLDIAGAAQLPGTGQRFRAVAERRAQYFAATGREKAALAQSLRADERRIAHESTEAAIASLTAHLADVASAGGRDLFGAKIRRDPAVATRVLDWRRRRRELLAVRQRIASDDALPFFAYDVHFGDILTAGGFDAVMGNPPWVRGERLPLTTRTLLASRYRTFRAAAPGRRGFAHLPDLSVVFVERALQLVRQRGVIGLILPAKLLRAGYAAPLRALLREKSTVLRLEDRSHGPASGFAATVFPMICVIRRETPDNGTAADVSVTGASGVCICGRAEQADLAIDAESPRSPWLAFPGAVVRAVRAALAAGPALASRYRPRLGVKTGANEVFVRETDRAAELPASHRVPAIRGRDISPFAFIPSAVILAALDARGNPLRDVNEEVRDYLKPHHSALNRRTDAHGAPPWALFRTELLEAPWMVLWRDIANGLEAVAIERTRSGPIPLNTCYGVAVPDEASACWLSAWLNAPPIRTLALALAERASGGAFRFSAGVVGALPIPDDPRSGLVAQLTDAGRRALEGKDVDDDALAALALTILGQGDTFGDTLGRLDAALRRDAGGNR
jgi:hypothetical protein